VDSKALRAQHTHPIPRKYLELTQDAIVFCLCALLLAEFQQNVSRQQMSFSKIRF